MSSTLPFTLYPPRRIIRDVALAVAGAIFMVSWSSHDYPEAKPFLVLGIGYLFVAFLDGAHFLSYRGMGVLPNTTDDATRFWVAARGLQALATLAFVFFVRKGRQVPPIAAFAVGGALTLFTFLSVFLWNIFPVCLVEGVGVTPFKKISEYVICASADS